VIKIQVLFNNEICTQTRPTQYALITHKEFTLKVTTKIFGYKSNVLTGSSNSLASTILLI